MKWPQKLAFLEMSPAGPPAEGAACFVLGYPLRSQMGSTLKVTQGIVSGKASVESGTDLLTDAKVNPGNSGGPMLDAREQLIGLVTLKSLASRILRAILRPTPRRRSSSRE